MPSNFSFFFFFKHASKLDNWDSQKSKEHNVWEVKKDMTQFYPPFRCLENGVFDQYLDFVPTATEEHYYVPIAILGPLPVYLWNMQKNANICLSHNQSPWIK